MMEERCRGYVRHTSVGEIHFDTQKNMPKSGKAEGEGNRLVKSPEVEWVGGAEKKDFCQQCLNWFRKDEDEGI